MCLQPLRSPPSSKVFLSLCARRWELLARESRSGPRVAWLLPAALGRGHMVPGEGEVAEPGLEQGCFSCPENVAVLTLASPRDLNRLEHGRSGFLQLMSNGKRVFSFAWGPGFGLQARCCMRQLDQVLGKASQVEEDLEKKKQEVGSPPPVGFLGWSPCSRASSRSPASVQS